MLLPLSLTQHHPIPTSPLPPFPNPLTDQSRPPFFSFSSPSLLTTRTSQSPKPLKFIVRSSNSDTQTESRTRTLLPKSAIQRIAEKLRGLGFTEEDPNPEPEPEPAGEIFVPLRNRLPNYRVGHTIDTSWSTPQNPVPEPGTGTAIKRFHELRSQAKKQKQEEKKTRARTTEREARVPTLAELTLAPAELRRLRTLGIALKKKLKVGKAGITEGIVNGIHERWRRSEVVKIVCEDICRMNMKRTHDLLEKKTGGLVVWRAGSKIVLFRGTNYEYPYFLCDKISTKEASNEEQNESHNSSGADRVQVDVPIRTSDAAQPALIQGVGLQNRVRFQLPGEAQLAEEADRLLDGLGPRFTDWWGYDPQPVDGDLLPAAVRGYRRPFRLLPYGVQPKLTDDEMTTLRRLARPLPCHFALGRNRKHQGLASSIVKLWEKCEVAKIAVKRGVQNTNSEIMAEELKRLTGGCLLARDREFIVLYRGKDFLPPAVSSAIKERWKSGRHAKKLRTEHNKSTAKDELETTQCGPNERSGTNDHKMRLLPEQRKLKFTEASVRRTSIKLSVALQKRAKAEQLLAELENAEVRQQPEIDKEGITEEERYMLRKIGLRMDAFLLLGRRGVFDGTIENMHLHWKYRELVKIISNEKSIEAVHQLARTLEAESGGILVAVERVSKGYAIIVYRGKNYERPANLRPKTLLNKKAAMKRSIEAQRRESLKLHVLKLTKNIDNLRLQLGKEEEVNDMQSIDESSNLVQDEVNEIQSTESLRIDAEDKSGSLTLPTASSEEHAVVQDEVKEIQSTKSLKIDTEDKSGSPSFPPTSSEEHVVVQDEVNEIKSTESLRIDAEDNSDSPSLPTTSGEEHVVVQDEVNEIQSTESLRIDAEEKSGSLSLPTTSNDEHVVSKGMSGAAVVGAPHGISGSSDNEAMESFTNKNGLEPSGPVMVDSGPNKMPSKTIHLSNRERLLLRKQALKMEKRPVIAVGKSNIVTGVAKTIMAHFQKHPLAIVNVKGRAKGTSVQEVVFMLEQATGAVLVSQEPSKVILYRGWGAGKNFGHPNKKNGRSDSNARGKLKTNRGVSPELLAAIRTECGFERQNKEVTTP
ncbi:RNA-binding, CRM domain containing protein [Trema orientale]|uniref:RNA-binding, CRM domain containing protein n=1 Tax=Trema orientale TaxID=63057 RepID=A0A2P5DRU6_TREOI|nr:RNA-binding, CRM domain containing protein [Trema orientale]